MDWNGNIERRWCDLVVLELTTTELLDAFCGPSDHHFIEQSNVSIRQT